jgi:T5SS/PEP-CTERM-associated repeat protein
MSQTINFGYAVWAGGSGDLASNWIIGYVESISANGVTSFVDWVYGAPTSDSDAYFEESISAPGTTDTTVGSGGDLSGDINAAIVGMEDFAPYTLTGELTAGTFDLGTTLTLIGTGAVVNTSSVAIGFGGSGILAIDNGGTVSATTGILVGDLYSGTLSVSGTGSTLIATEYITVGDYANGLVEISDAGVASVGQITIGSEADNSNGAASGTIIVSGAGSSLTTGNILVGDYGEGLLAISDGGAVSASEILVSNFFVPGAITVDGAGSTLRSAEISVTGNAADGGGGSLSIADQGTVVVSGSISIGGDTASGSLTVSGTQTTLKTQGLFIGIGGAEDNGGAVATISGGGDVSASNNVDVGDGAFGELTVTGADSTLSADFLAVGVAANGTITISDGGTVAASNAVLGVNSAPGTIVVTGVGSELVSEDLTVGQGASGSFYVEDGATASASGILSVGGTAGTLAVGGTNSAVTTAGDLQLEGAGGALVSVDLAGAIEIGGSDNEVAGSIVLDEGHFISGTGEVEGDVVNDGSIIVTGGTLTLRGTVTGTGTSSIDSGDDLIMSGAVAATQSVVFSGYPNFENPNGTLTIGDLANFAASVSGFQNGDVIDVNNVVANTVVYDAASGSFLLEEQTEGQPVAIEGSLDLVGIAPTTPLKATSDGNGGTDITFVTTVTQTVDLGYAVWGGGSGDLSAFNWIIGYEEIVTNGVASFDGWVYGLAPVTSSTVSIQSTLQALGETNTDVGDAGTLTGALNTSDDLNVGLPSGSTDVLSGNLAVSDADITSGDLTVGEAGAILNVGGLLKIEGGQLSVEYGGGVSAFAGVYVGYDQSDSATTINSTASLTLSGANSYLEDAADLYLGGTLGVIASAQATFAGSLNLFGQSSITVDPTAEMEIGGGDNLSTGTIVVDPTYSISGSGEVTGSVANNGQIAAQNVSSSSGGSMTSTLTLNGSVTGTGTLLVGGSGTLELNGAVGAGQTVEFTGSTGALILGDPQYFQGSIIGLQAGDQIIIPVSALTNSDSVIAAPIVQMGSTQMLPIFEGSNSIIPTAMLPNIPIEGTAGGNDLANDYFQVTPNGSDDVLTLVDGPQPGFVIKEDFDPSVANLATTNVSTQMDFEIGVEAAVLFYQNTIVNPITTTMNFGWGEVDNGQGVGGLGASLASKGTYTYAQLYAAVQATDTTSSVQRTAAKLLPVPGSASAPPSSATFLVTTAEERALGLPFSIGRQTDYNNTDGSIGLSSGVAWSWIQQSTPVGTYDAVGTLEHEISEVLGRTGYGGANNMYGLLDMYRYTAANGGNMDASGTAVGQLDEPFNPNYLSTGSVTPGTNQPGVSAYSYFSWNGQTITFQFETPPDVAGGSDVTDWAPSVTKDSFADIGPNGPLGPAVVSPTDLQVMNVLGYDIPSVTACYVGGTRILTDRGEVAVQALSVGDVVQTIGGSTAPIVWIGCRRVNCMRQPDARNVWPVRVRAGAFDDAIPHRDLWLSPDHAVFVDGVLIPIKYLINGTSIEQVPYDDVTYYHIELPKHDLVLAEGLLAESYLDIGDRSNFQNGGGPMRLFPNFAAPSLGTDWLWETQSCAPIVITGERLRVVRNRLNSRMMQKPTCVVAP